MSRFVFLICGLYLVTWLVVSHNDFAIQAMTATKISSLVSTPDKYEGRHITTIGVVVNRVSVLGYGKFGLHDVDDDSVIDVVTTKAVPPLGTRVTISGVFKQAFAIDGVQCSVIVED